MRRVPSKRWDQVPKLVEGHLCNSKITKPDDLPLVELFMSIDTGIQKKLF